MKKTLYKIKEDLKKLFIYPDVFLRSHPQVDYAFYWEKRGRRDLAILSTWQRQRADMICSYIKKGDFILDIGCGDGALLGYLCVKTEAKGIGVDMDIKVLENAEKIGIKTYVGDLRDHNFINNLPEVDWVVGFEILEHIPEPEKLVIDLEKKTRKGMFFSFPNTGYYIHRLRLLFGRFPLQWITHPAEHVRYWTATDVIWWVKSCNLNLGKMYLYQGITLLNKILPKIFAQGILIYIRTDKSNGK